MATNFFSFFDKSISGFLTLSNPERQFKDYYRVLTIRRVHTLMLTLLIVILQKNVCI